MRGAAPAVVFLAALLVYPLGRFILSGLNEGGVALYLETARDPVYRAIFFETFAVGLASTALSIAIAYPFAYLLATTTRFWATLGFLVLLLPFWTSIVVRTYAWMILLGRNGVVNKTLMSLGAVEQPLPLMFNQLGTLIGMVHWLLPFAAFPIYAAMTAVDRRIVLAARGLGAGPVTIFLRIWLPLTLHGVLAAGAIVFVLSIAAFVTPVLLGGGKVFMMAQLVEQQVRQFLDWPLAAALSVLLTASAILLYALLRWIMRRAWTVA